MEEYANRYLFPFHRVPKGCRIVIYGAGKLGQEYVRQVMETDWCSIVALVDRNHEAYRDFCFPVIPAERLHEKAFDFVVVAIRSSIYRREMLSMLLKQSIPREKIICQEAGEYRQLFQTETRLSDYCGRAYSHSEKSILFSMGDGFGDMLVQKKTIEAFLELDDDIAIDILCSSGKEFLEFLFEDCPQVKNIDLFLGNRFEEECRKYACAARLAPMPAIEICVRSEAHPFSKELECALEKLQHPPVEIRSAYEGIYRSIYQGETFYTRGTCQGILPAREKWVHIPQDAVAGEMFQKMQLTNYITMNFGNGSTTEASLVAKSWSRERFESVIDKIHEFDPDLEIVQIGGGNAKHLKGADRYMLGRSFPLVAEILRHSLLHIDTEGGLVHLATHLGTKCIVLFGPTQIPYYGYPENVNLHAGTCHDCYALYPDVNRCARDLAEPECMYSITPEMVMEAVREYLDGLDGKEKAVQKCTTSRASCRKICEDEVT